MQIQDERTPEQKKSHTVIIAGTDSFLSGWGKAQGGVSFAGWACRPEDYLTVFWWVKNRKDMKRVRIVGNDWRPRGQGHCHIYAVTENHPALKQ